MNCCHPHRSKCLLDSLLMTNLYLLCECRDGGWGQEAKTNSCVTLPPKPQRTKRIGMFRQVLELPKYIKSATEAVK